MTVKEVLDQFRYMHGPAYTLSCYIERGPGMTYEGPIPEHGVVINGKDMSEYTVYDFSTLVDVVKRSATIYLHC